MAAGDKPAARLTLKPDGGAKEDRITIASAWREGGASGKLGSFKLDKRVKQLAVQLEDGTVVRMQQANGRWTHYLDVFVNDEVKPAAATGAAPFGPPAEEIFDGDEIPF